MNLESKKQVAGLYLEIGLWHCQSRKITYATYATIQKYGRRGQALE